MLPRQTEVHTYIFFSAVPEVSPCESRAEYDIQPIVEFMLRVGQRFRVWVCLPFHGAFEFADDPVVVMTFLLVFLSGTVCPFRPITSLPDWKTVMFSFAFGTVRGTGAVAQQRRCWPLMWLTWVQYRHFKGSHEYARSNP